MLKKFLLFFFLLIANFSHSQDKYPTDEFISPLEIPLLLSGTFGELRSNHFHSGFDIKTQQKEGLNVIASGSGYVSRINVSRWGYGKALYITHPNGYTTVYGHLKQFSPEIEAYVKRKQYEKESFEIRLYPKSEELKVTKGDIIALSGNSGSSGGPHLHYEIRDVKADIINPMLFGIKIPDHKKPTIQSGFAYSRNDTSQVNQSNKIVNLNLARQNNGDLLANSIYAYGEIGIGINAFDRLDGAINRNGLYDLILKVNGETKFKFTADKFSFSESRYINTYIDYSRYINLRQRVQKCFIELPVKNLNLYKTIVNNGFFEVKDSLDYQVEIIARDFVGNKTKMIIPIKGRRDSIIIKKTEKKTPYFFKANEVNKISEELVTVSFPKGSFYKDLYFDFSFVNGVAKLHYNTIPLHKNFRVSFDVTKSTNAELKQMYIARVNDKGKSSYVGSRHKDGYMYALSKTLGNYTLKSDKEKPKVYHYNFRSGQNLAKKRYLKVRISDSGSGIRSYRGEINGKWVLMEYNPKLRTLSYDFQDNKISGNDHTLKVIVTDNVNNSTTFTTTFSRKN